MFHQPPLFLSPVFAASYDGASSVSWKLSVHSACCPHLTQLGVSDKALMIKRMSTSKFRENHETYPGMCVNWKKCQYAEAIDDAAVHRLAQSFQQRICWGDPQTRTLATVIKRMQANASALLGGKIIAEGSTPPHELESWLQTAGADEVVTQNQVKYICEIGFNRGYSAAAWLCSFPKAKYITFDLMRYAVSTKSIEWLNETFPNRLQLYLGDTRKSLAILQEKHFGMCDVLSIDGGHNAGQALNDIQMFAQFARKPRNLVIMDNTHCSRAWGWCAGPTLAWDRLRRRGNVTQFGCRVSGCCDGWCWGMYN